MLSFKTDRGGGFGEGKDRGSFFCVEIFILFFSKCLDKEKEKK